MKKKHKLWLIFASAFIAGIILGTGGGYLIGKRRTSRRMRPEMGVVKRRFIKDLDRNVQLNEVQKKQISIIMDKHFKKLREFRMQLKPQMQEMKDQFFADVQAQLRPEQTAGFERFKKELQEMVRRHMSKHDRRNREMRKKRYKEHMERRRRNFQRDERFREREGEHDREQFRPRIINDEAREREHE